VGESNVQTEGFPGDIKIERDIFTQILVLTQPFWFIVWWLLHFLDNRRQHNTLKSTTRTETKATMQLQTWNM